MAADPINPPHYTSHPSGVQAIEVAEQWGWCLGNVFKYMIRAGRKGDAIEDFCKARWYLAREIDRRQCRVDTAEVEARSRRSQRCAAAYARFVDAEPDAEIRQIVQLLWAAEFAPSSIGDAAVVVPLLTALEIVDQMIAARSRSTS